ncbi:MAG TPA: sulfate adenylyltransferase subunit CysN [Candidatus Krumholzibacteria bacterium]|nr:sulfate adenylyltransferase subunit CysN [Candidatus Krumholzibacteria bacterium]HPD72277.1 sulfate adenylyltransferase subunit CysN [Candidatus Krumholzibacteria bacterium]HRY40791.1 sulfate adenylyltransferase subunit CysN [Candidatus Krumholzibacteria bacterium]
MGDHDYRVQDEDLIRDDIAGYLRKHETKDLLRLLTCGSVDDGKSTLIGRLLYDSKMIYEDQLAAVTRDSKIHGTVGGDFDPALLTDGLKAEREQGITIDVAYRYFSTAKRKFIIADCPGHEQYTRNMATGASTADLAVIIIDARHGVVTQTKRHAFICSLLGIKHVAVAINKLDLVGWSEAVYDRIREDFNAFVSRLAFADIHFFPICALRGDNVVDPSEHTPWYDGATLLHHMENVNIASDRNLIDMRLPVQYVMRPHLDFRGFAGTIASGVVRAGDSVVSLPSRRHSRIKAVYVDGEPIAEAFAPMAVTVTLADEIDVSRGDLLAPVHNVPTIGHDLEAMVVWMHEIPAEPGRTYLIKHTTNLVPGVLGAVRYKMDVDNLRKAPGEAHALRLNEIGRVHLTMHRPIAFDPYDRNRATGAFIIIDRVTNVTVGAGMIIDRVVREPVQGPKSRHIAEARGSVSRRDRERRLGQRGFTVWLTGLSGSGKSTIAYELERQLAAEGRLCYVLDGDNIRHGLNSDLAFSADDRAENIRRIAEVARLMNEVGVIVISAFISPYRADRRRARDIVGDGAFLEVHLDTPLAVCEARDPKGLYRKVRAGEIPQFTGITDPYEAPEAPELRLETATLSAERCAGEIVAALRGREVLP